ncbi:MAG: flagellar protein FlgN, partial [Loktanella sp.]|nr:flagellar protein FlgN [Loktanella sp.]
LLAKEGDAILSAQYDALDRSAQRKQDLFEQLGMMQPAADGLKLVAAALARNELLLAAALRGLAAAQDRFAMLNDIRTGLNVYDQTGQMARVQIGRPAVTRKA